MKPRPPLPAGPYLIVGLARSGIAAALTLSARGERVTGVDTGSPDVEALVAAGIEARLDTDGLAQLADARCVVKSPGVPAQAPVIEAARARGLPVLGELELAWRLLPNEFIAVTGTNGKTTTVELVGHIHREAALPVAVAGNVGVAASGLVGRLSAEATVVCEASSFQLEDTEAFAPEAAVLLNISPDHLDRHGTMDAYRAAKLRAFARQGNYDVAVAPLDLPGTPDLGGCARRVTFGRGAGADLSERQGQLFWEEEPLIPVSDIGLRGAHNVDNAMAAAATSLARGVDVDAVRAGLRSFPGVAHRLEEVAVRDGVAYVNDSKATNVASALVALAAFPEDTVHLIAGGLGKGQDFAPLRPAVERACRAVYLIGRDGPAIGEVLRDAGARVKECETLERAVAAAASTAGAGETVLLSPACASYDQFADFEERGRRFRELASGRS